MCIRDSARDVLERWQAEQRGAEGVGRTLPEDYFFFIRDIKKKIALLFDWIAEAKAELAKPQAPDLVSLLNAYYTQRKAGAYSQKGKISNLKEINETFNYLRANGIYTLEDLESHVNEHTFTCSTKSSRSKNCYSTGRS